MSGHSKWSKIKRKKGASDAKKGKVFAKLIREITIATRIGGGDPNGNPRLRLVMDKARQANMPFENIQRAIKKGLGEAGGQSLEEFTLEGYGPGGSAILVEALSDNRNRTVADIRHIFTKLGGNLGEAGCVQWMFTKQGILIFPKTVSEEKLFEVALEAGALDIKDSGDVFEVLTTPHQLVEVKTACEKKSLLPTEATFQMIPQNTIRLEGMDAEKMLKLMEALEEHDDVQEVHANFDIDEALMEKLSA